jgi:hypothetical protein
MVLQAPLVLVCVGVGVLCVLVRVGGVLCCGGVVVVWFGGRRCRTEVNKPAKK